MVKHYTILYEIQEWEDFCQQNSWKKPSSGHHVKVIPIILFSDDVSGNVSKKWNKFDIWAMLLAGLPRAVNNHLENIHFLSASNKVDWLEMAKPIVEDLLMLEQKGMLAYDACLEEEVFVIAPVICALADNPRASDITGHIGSSGKLYCRICEVGMQKCAWGISNNCIQADKRQTPEEVSTLRSKCRHERQMKRVCQASSDKERKKLQTKYGVAASVVLRCT